MTAEDRYCKNCGACACPKRELARRTRIALVGDYACLLWSPDGTLIVGERMVNGILHHVRKKLRLVGAEEERLK